MPYSVPIDFTFYTDSYFLDGQDSQQLFASTFPFVVFGETVQGQIDTGPISQEWIDAGLFRKAESLDAAHMHLVTSSDNDFLPENSTVLIMEPDSDDTVISGATLLKRLLLRKNKVVILGMVSQLPPGHVLDRLTPELRQAQIDRDQIRYDENRAAFRKIYEYARLEAKTGESVGFIRYVPLGLQMTNRGRAAFYSDTGNYMGRSIFPDQPTDAEREATLYQIRAHRPDLIIIPARTDNFRQHVAVHSLGLDAIRQWVSETQNPARIFELALLSNEVEVFDVNGFVIPTLRDRAQQLELLKFYGSQLGMAFNPSFLDEHAQRVARVSRPAFAALDDPLNFVADAELIQERYIAPLQSEGDGLTHSLPITETFVNVQSFMEQEAAPNQSPLAIAHSPGIYLPAGDGFIDISLLKRREGALTRRVGDGMFEVAFNDWNAEGVADLKKLEVTLKGLGLDMNIFFIEDPSIKWIHEYPASAVRVIRSTVFQSLSSIQNFISRTGERLSEFQRVLLEKFLLGLQA